MTAAGRWPARAHPVDAPALAGQLVTGPIAGSTKGHRQVTDVPGASVPFRRVALADDEHLDLYDASGPYTDAAATIDLSRGLLPRPGVFGDRGTQLQRARDGVVTAEMALIAAREGVRPKLVRDEVAAGRAVIPANSRHPESEPMIIGRAFRVKVAATVGVAHPQPATDVVADMVWAIRCGADTVVAVSMDSTLERLLRNSPVPVGTEPLRTTLRRTHGEPAALTWEGFRDTVLEHAERGVDCISVPAGVRLDHVGLTAGRLSGIVDRGGAAIATWCLQQRRESFLYTHFDELCRILSHYDVILALAAGLSPGSIADANDAAQFAELSTLGELARAAKAHGVQVMIEGPGYLPMHKTAEVMRLQQQLGRDTPFFGAGPLTTDVALGHGHVASAIGAAVVAQAGVSLLHCVTAEGLPTAPDRTAVKDAVVAHRIAAHAADLAKGNPQARERDDALARARLHCNRSDAIALSLDPEGGRGARERCDDPGVKTSRAAAAVRTRGFRAAGG